MIRAAAQGPVGAGIRGLVRFAKWEIEETLGETGFLEPCAFSLRLLGVQSSRQIAKTMKNLRHELAGVFPILETLTGFYRFGGTAGSVLGVLDTWPVFASSNSTLLLASVEPVATSN